MLFAPAWDRTRPVDPGSTRIDNEHYDGFGDAWWDPSGPVAGLHEMNPVRGAYFHDVFRAELGEDALREGRFLDVGCGGGLLTEALAARGYRITGIDVSDSSLAAARRHAEAESVEVRYRRGSVYELDEGSGEVDGVVISDVLEHLHDLPRAVAELVRVLRPGGILAFDTINRTVKSYVVMIVLAQNLVSLVEPRTHDWRLFIKPAELSALLAGRGCEIRGLRGLVPAKPLPLAVASVVKKGRVGGFRLADDLSVSYVGWAVKGQPVKG